jgi:hypothetical protein
VARDVQVETGDVVLYPNYRVNPLSFRLEPKWVLGKEKGRMMTEYPVDTNYLWIFRATLCQDVDSRAMIRHLERVGAKETSSQIIIRLFEAGLLSAFGEKAIPFSCKTG